MNPPIYLDYNATTPVDPRVREAMLPFLGGDFGNPSSGHHYGHVAAEAVDRGRGQVAALLGCSPEEIVFTGGGSEADNLALIGVGLAGTKRHIISQATEHPAVLETVRYMVERLGFRATILPVNGDGRVDPGAVAAAIELDTAIVSIMHANNETGVIQPVAEIGAICRERGVPFHTDAAQSVGKIPTRVDEMNVDLLTIAGHKLYAPKGVGALFVRNGVRLDSLIHGAGHESGRRAGTENVAGIGGLGAACAVAMESPEQEGPRIRGLRDRLHRALAAGTTTRLNGHMFERLPNTLNLSFPGFDGEEILARTPEIAAATGSACHSGRTEPSGVLLAMGVSPEVAIGAVRLTLGRFTTAEEIDLAADALLRTLATTPSAVS